MNLELMGVDTLILDLGGVLLDLDEQLPWDNFRMLGADLDGEDVQMEVYKLCQDFEVNAMEPIEWATKMSEAMGIDSSFSEIFEAWNTMLLDIPDERKDVLIELSKRYRLILLSNTNEIHLRTLFSRENKDYDEDLLLDHMDREYYSNKLEVRKPNQEIFQAVLIDNQLDPSQCLFIDDKDHNLEGAVGLGINTYHLDLRKENLEDLFDFENDMI
jgi:putative hydrolase of the HAD superfamily